MTRFRPPNGPRQIPVPYEQAVYGSFPFWDRGYALLAQSPGCRPEWLAGLRTACQRIGEQPAGASEAPGLFALRLPEGGPWMIVGVGPQGADDRGRPGALAFHALFVAPRDYLAAGAFPFDFAPSLRYDWTAQTRTLSAGTQRIDPPGSPPDPPSDLRAGRIASALAAGRRVALQSAAPIDDLARQVWLALPVAVRGRRSVATWAFSNGNRFDLVALPRLAGVALDPSYQTDETIGTGTADGDDPAGCRPPGASGGRSFARPLPWRRLGVAAVGLLLAGGAAALALRGDHDGEPVTGLSPRTESPTTRSGPAPADLAPPDPSRYHTLEPGEPDPDQRRRVTEGLVDLAERCGVLDPETPGRDDPAALMILLADRLRYRGPWLSAGELATLKRADSSSSSTSHDRALAREWHARVRRFAPDRPLPDRFEAGPLRWQLDTLAWSFHLDPDPDAPRRALAEVVHALADALAVDVPLRETPLSAHSPALTGYRAFLGRLPRR